MKSIVLKTMILWLGSVLLCFCCAAFSFWHAGTTPVFSTAFETVVTLGFGGEPIENSWLLLTVRGSFVAVSLASFAFLAALVLVIVESVFPTSS